MKQARSSQFLERNPASDLWRHTLSQIPSVFGRMVYLAGLRNANTGRYEHQGLALVFGEAEADRALRTSHEQCFLEWRNYGLEQQKADLDLYLTSLDENRRNVVRTWAAVRPYQAYPPAAARGPERSQFLSDIEALLQLLRNEFGVASEDRAE